MAVVGVTFSQKSTQSYPNDSRRVEVIRRSAAAAASRSAFDETHVIDVEEEPTKTTGGKCVDAVPGTQCFVYVMWAMRTGINVHPEWYGTLTKDSSFEDFQHTLHEKGHGACAAPCRAPGAAAARSPLRDVSGAAKCQNPKPGEQCYVTVQWALESGVKSHPEWYTPLTAESTFLQFQVLIHDEGHGGCELPCVEPPPTSTSTTSTSTETSSTRTLTKTSTSTRTRTRTSTRTTTRTRPPTRTRTRTRTHSSTTTTTTTTTYSFPPLPTLPPLPPLPTMVTATTTTMTTTTTIPIGATSTSSTTFTSTNKTTTKRVRPKRTMKTTTNRTTESTTTTVKTNTTTSSTTSMTTSTTSSTTTTTTTTSSTSNTTTSTSTTFTVTTTTTTTTCVPKRNYGSPSLFCYSVMQIQGIEQALIRQQWEHRSSIFSCDDFAVISQKQLSLGKDECGNDIWTWVNDLPSVPLGKLGQPGVTTSSYLNTQTFLIAWDTLMNSGLLWDRDFVVKVDPDCVFFPDRLREHVTLYRGQSVYFLNCFMGGGKLFGSLEVISVPAMRNYQGQVSTCQAKLPWHGWGEDLYMEQCLKMIGVFPADDFDMVGDNRCRGAPCSDPSRVAYHPFKDPGGYDNCWQQSHSAELAARGAWMQARQ